MKVNLGKELSEELLKMTYKIKISDFIEFIDMKNHKSQESQEVSAYDLAKEWAGCVESGIGDLSTNKKYLQGFGK